MLLDITYGIYLKKYFVILAKGLQELRLRRRVNHHLITLIQVNLVGTNGLASNSQTLGTAPQHQYFSSQPQ